MRILAAIALLASSVALAGTPNHEVWFASGPTITPTLGCEMLMFDTETEELKPVPCEYTSPARQKFWLIEKMEESFEREAQLREEMAWWCAKSNVYREQLRAIGQPPSSAEKSKCAELRKRIEGAR